ncbi:ubiquinol-cytochrome C chaperone family protein [Phyllobacterium zundukense]|uniref:Ubiquinol-cytochrome C chaperone n=1 Tax=Phyllobacterium zundukense TaxID=1867719 RepID=A0A2N9W3Y9_9HYPH|nr:ubiquinol-cytochrome C chaperone family protein [Phyllobacterium zundukense]ATU92070.1 ubiquinol-cytochrome C chaperone [Phyllobacterium zundukense]PIO46457.1 ubiquinol-cytochrome C chaperone [Phyllobacterium zundukense]
MILSLFSRKAKANEAITIALYDAIVAAARQPYFYSDLDVPDSPLGRYEMLSLHVFLFMRRIKGRTPALKSIGQEVTDEFFRDVDHSLRELGIGDSGVPKRMKKLARMFYGRIESYDKALASNDYSALVAALARNVRPDSENWPGASALGNYVLQASRHLEDQSDDMIASGKVTFPEAGAAALEEEV